MRRNTASAPSVLIFMILSLFLLFPACDHQYEQIKRSVTLEGTVYDPNAFQEDMMEILNRHKVYYVGRNGVDGECGLRPQNMTEREKQVAYREFLEKGEYEFDLQLLKAITQDDLEFGDPIYNGRAFVVLKGYAMDESKETDLFPGEITWTFDK